MNDTKTNVSRRRAPDLEQAIGAKLRQIRNVRQISQEKLGEELGITFQQVQKYESGRNRVAVSTLVRIAKILNVGVMDLFPDDEEIRQHSDIDRPTPQVLAMAAKISINLARLDPKISQSLERHIALIANGGAA